MCDYIQGLELVCVQTEILCLSSMYFLILYLAVRPLINREKLQKLTVRAGTSVKFDVDVKGEPPPTITWHFAGKQLETGATVKIENEDYNTKIQLSETERKNTGFYTIKAENSSGSDEARVEVVILGESTL